MSSNRRSTSTGYVAVLGAAVSCYAALGAVLSILPRYVPERLGAGSLAIGIAVGAPALTGLLARPLGGHLADRLGPLPPLLVGAAVMAAGAVPAASSVTFGALVASRLAVGAGEGLMMAASVLWLLRLAGPARRGRALGHIGLANYAGLALGPLLAAAVGGAAASGTVLWLATVPPLVGGAGALAARRLAGARPDEAAPDATAGATRPARESDRASALGLVRVIAPTGVGLLLVNVGYVSVLSFGAAVARANDTGLESLIVPVFAVVVIVARSVFGVIPDRLGGRRTVVLFAGAEALGLLSYAQFTSPALALIALIVFAVGQSMAVPGLGLLALARVPAAQQGAAAGVFFAWFDAGVGAGGPTAGAVAAAAGPAGALTAAAAAVACAIAIASLVGRAGSREVRPTAGAAGRA